VTRTWRATNSLQDIIAITAAATPEHLWRYLLARPTVRALPE
jgi:hypothetical protein